LVLALTLVLFSASSVRAVTPEEFRQVRSIAPAGATVPLEATVEFRDGVKRKLGEMIAKPAVLVFADYTCTTLCGPIVAFVVAALEKSGLRPGTEFQVLVIGIDPKDSVADAERMRRNYALSGSLDAATLFVRADQPTVQRLTSALGYHYVYDTEHDQFVHPGAAYVLRTDGRVTRVLTGLGLSGADLRLALVEAGEGRIGNLTDEVRLLCSGFDPASGTYNLLISRVLMGATLATIAAMAAGIMLLTLMGRRGAA
jgi:protein SCO1/2